MEQTGGVGVSLKKVSRVFFRLGIDPLAWCELYQAIHDDCRTWSVVSQELAECGAPKVSRQSAKKWMTSPTEAAIKAACEYAARKKLMVRGDSGAWSDFEPVSGEPDEYTRSLKRETRSVHRDAELGLAVERALCLGSAFMCLNWNGQEILRRMAYALFTNRIFRIEHHEGAYSNDAAAAYEALVGNATIARREFSGFIPDLYETVLDDGEIELCYVPGNYESDNPRDEKRVLHTLWYGE